VLLPDGRRRAFSIANAPHEGDNIELHVRHVAGGDFTSYVFDGMENGAMLRVEGPLGTFVPREDSERPMLLVAGGTGFAPIKALIEHFRHLGTRRPMQLYWGARTLADLYLRALPERWTRDDPSFRFVPVLSDTEHAGDVRRGFVHEAVLEDHADLSGFDLYMSGPPTMIDAGRRAFSIANAPHDGDMIELHVRHVAGGGFTSYVFDELQNGAMLRVEGPLGTFVPREDSERPLLMVAGGTGFAPIKALIEHFRQLGSLRPITLYWGARTARDLYLRALPERWARDVPSFRFVSVLSDSEHAGTVRHGFVHEAVLEDHADLSAFDLYMSGPPTMIDAGRRAFVDAGLPEDRLFYDSFDYAPDVLAEILRSRAGILGM